MKNQRPNEKPQNPQDGPVIITVGELMKQVERMADIRRRVREGYYDQPEILAKIAHEIRNRLK